jgi:mutator protein MutT
MNRYCITCGKIATKQNDSLYMCEAGHENWINPATGAAVFIVKNNKVLYGVRNQEPFKGKLDIPGGFIEVGETAEQAALRETKEELGIDVELITMLGTYASVYQGRPTLDIVFVGRIGDEPITPGDDLEGSEPVWRDIDGLPSSDENPDAWFPEAQEALRRWLQK